MGLRVLVVDDEPLARLGVTARLRTHADLVLVGECSSGEDAIESIQSLAPDLLLLDIEMPGFSGIDVLRALPKNLVPCVIFLTAYTEYATDAFEVEALDYLLKPIDDVRFAASLERARRVFALRQHHLMCDQFGSFLNGPGEQVNPPTRFAVRRGPEVTFVRVEDIDWIEGLGDYAGLHVGPKTHLIRESLTSLESRLDRKEFLRIHRSTIVKTDRIVGIESLANQDFHVTLRDHVGLRASRTYSKALRSFLLESYTKRGPVNVLRGNSRDR
jgi:two-component system LytT family response regulator